MVAKKTKTPARDKQAIIVDVLDGMRVDGLSLRKSCLAAGVALPTFLDWVAADEILADHYTRAREVMLEKIADETMEIADAPVGSTDSGATDSGAVAKQRLQVDTRKWLLSKLAPKKYGEKVETALVGSDGGPVKIQQIERVIIDPSVAK